MHFGNITVLMIVKVAHLYTKVLGRSSSENFLGVLAASQLKEHFLGVLAASQLKEHF